MPLTTGNVQYIEHVYIYTVNTQVYAYPVAVSVLRLFTTHLWVHIHYSFVCEYRVGRDGVKLPARKHVRKWLEH